MVKGSVDTVAIFFKQRRVAEHRRLWTREDVSFDPRHYLAPLERKPGALDHARPLENWDLPKCFGVLRRRLEGQLAGMGTREYIGVLRLLEKHPLGALTRAVTKGLRCGGLTRDAIAQFLLPQEPWGETTFRLDGREHLRRVQVSRTDVSAYAQLLATPAGGLS